MAGFPLPNPRPRFFDTNGDPLAGGKLYAYQAGTSTPQNTYADQALLTPNANPVVLDANGEATIFVPDSTLYKFVLKDSADVTQWTEDNISVPSTTPAAAADPVPTGAILAYGGSSAPTGFLIGDGSAISRATYAALFAVLGTTYGAGDGSTTFNLPDLRQRFPIGKAAAGTANVLGATGGAIDHVHTGPSHTHDVTVPRDNWGAGAEVPSTVDGRIRTSLIAGAGADAGGYFATADQVKTSTAGGTGNTGTANPPYQVVNYIVKT
jgi:microcystin-dependent protein